MTLPIISLRKYCILFYLLSRQHLLTNSTLLFFLYYKWTVMILSKSKSSCAVNPSPFTYSMTCHCLLNLYFICPSCSFGSFPSGYNTVLDVSSSKTMVLLPCSPFQLPPHFSTSYIAKLYTCSRFSFFFLFFFLEKQFENETKIFSFSGSWVKPGNCIICF